MTETYDVVIAGGAAMGSSVAYHLLADPAFGGRVLVVEKDSTYRRSASALSAASIRQQFSSPVNIRISLYGIRFLREIGERLAVDGERPEIGLQGGRLSLPRERGRRRGPRREPGPADRRKAPTSCSSTPKRLRRAFPGSRTDDLACGTWGRSGEGWFDGWGLLQAFRRKARALGAEYRAGEVADIEREGERVAAVRLATAPAWPAARS